MGEGSHPWRPDRQWSRLGSSDGGGVGAAGVVSPARLGRVCALRLYQRQAEHRLDARAQLVLSVVCSVGRFCDAIRAGTLGALGVPIVMLAPAWWKRRVDIGPGTDRKDEARSKVIARWPAMADRFARKKDDSRAEACLIAVAGLTREAGR